MKILVKRFFFVLAAIVLAMAVQKLRAFALLLLVVLSACSHTAKSPDVPMSLIAHLTDADGTPVPNAPEPEVVQLKSVETGDRTLNVRVGNTAGDYVLVCDLDANRGSWV